jgi:hypothetical protein
MGPFSSAFVLQEIASDFVETKSGSYKIKYYLTSPQKVERRAY